MVEKLNVYKNKFLDFYQRHEVLVSSGVFIAGFVFDLLTLGRVDDLINLIQQAIYLIILGTLLLFEIKLKIRTLTLSERGKRFWEYHNLIVHFLFGSLLSVYTIFYYTSSSAFTSLIFITLLAGLMLANEFPQFQRLGLPVRIILFSICVLSYFSFFYPILMGHVGAIPSWLGVITSMGVMTLVWTMNFKNISIPLLKHHVLRPALAVHLFFVTGYYASFIPPVPVALKKIGIYYSVEKKDGDYIGHHLRPFWKIWGRGSQHFLARPGDKVMVLLSIFSPARFEDKVFLKWYYDDPAQGWTLKDTLPLTILGGRDGGFRGFGSKSNFQPGDWRIEVETSDGREVGRIGMTIEMDESSDTREFQQDIL